MTKSAQRMRKTLDWMLERGPWLEEKTVVFGCKDCGETDSCMASTARTCWLPKHWDHEVWMKNPFPRKVNK